MKHINRFAVAFIVCFCVGLPLIGDTETVGGYTWTYRIVGDTAEIYGGESLHPAIDSSSSGSVVIPSTLGGKPVMSIGDSAFYYCSGLTSVTIPNSVTNIGFGAFLACIGLTSVMIPEGVTSIGDIAFLGCIGLTSVTIPDSVTSIGDEAFYYCSSIKSVTLPQCVCANRIASYFDTYQSFTNVVISDSVTSIGNGAFAGCSGLTSVTIGNGVTSIGDGAFYGCNCLASVTIPDGVTSIGTSAFYGCSGLTSVTIPDSVTSIGEQAFRRCSALASVTIPDSVTIIGNEAFSDCGSLTSVYITDLAKWCGISLPSSGSPLSCAQYLFLNGAKVTDLVIPDGVTNIANYAFQGWSGLESVTIPDSVTSIGDKAFYGCSSLVRVTVPDSVVDYGADCFEGCPAYTRSFYRAIFSINSGGGSQVAVTTVVQNVEAPYDLSDGVADRSIASVTVDSDCAIDEFVLKDGKVYDCAVRIVNTANNPVKLTLPRGYEYEAFKGTKPLTIPAMSRNILTITRTADNTFLVSRRQLEIIE